MDAREIDRQRLQISWPPRSPDLIPLDSLLQDYVKNIVYQVKTNDVQHLGTCIKDAMARLMTSMLEVT